MGNYCFEHAKRELAMIEYFDPNRKIGKTIFRIPTKEKRYKCVGAHANETPKQCTKWGIYFVGFISKKLARNEHSKILRGKN